MPLLKRSIFYPIRITCRFPSREARFVSHARWTCGWVVQVTYSSFSSADHHHQQQQQQQRRRRQVSDVDWSRRQASGVMYSDCPVSSSADCNATRHENVGRPSTSVTPQTSTRTTTSGITRPQTLKPPTYPSAAPHRLDVDVCVASSRSNDRCQQLNSNVDVRATARSDLPHGTDVISRPQTFWTHRKSLSLPTRQ